MSSFKISKKNVHTDGRTSIMEKHLSTITNIENEKNNITKYNSELILLKKTYEMNFKKQNFDNLYMLTEKINKITEKIYNIENGTEMSEYLFNSIDFIKKIDDFEHVAVDETNNDGIFRYITMDSKNNKGEMYKSYMETCFPNEVPRNSTGAKINEFRCKDCNKKTTNDISSGITICFNCGLTDNYNISTLPEWNYSETHEYIKPYSYKRTNHFKEWINQIQGREGTIIPTNVLNLIIGEIKKERLRDKSLVTYHKVKEFLKKLKLNKYYEHIPNIIHKITGNRQLIINSELQEKLIDMFNEIQVPFEKHCPKDRKNFLSYSYTLYKFFQLLKKDDYLIYFPLLKSREKLFEQENIWKKICVELKWDFYPCI